MLNDAYNANPTSMAAALDMLVAVERTGRTAAVLGVMAEIGDEHEAEHESLGRLAVDHDVDLLVVVGRRRRRHRAGRGGRRPRADRRVEVADADAALTVVRDWARDGDVVLVKASRVGGLEAVADGLTRGTDGEEADS